jgi:hypothetical protein
MNSCEGSNSVSTPRAPQSRNNLVTVPKSRLKFEGSQAYIIRRRRAYKVTLQADGLYKYRTFGMTWLVEVV